MTSPFATLLTALQARIQDKVTAIRYIDQDLGQLQDEMRPAISFPAALIDFGSFAYEDLGENKQTAVGTVSIRLIFSAWSNSNSLTPEEWKDKALGFYDIEWDLYKALQGWKPENLSGNDSWTYGYMMRTGAMTETNAPGLRIRNLQFSIIFEDDKAKIQYQKTNLKPPTFLEPTPSSPTDASNPFKVKF